MIRIIGIPIIALLWVQVARAEERWALIVGNNRGLAGEGQLEWAEEDARKVRDVLRELGNVPPENMVVLLGDDAETVRRSLIGINDRIRQGDPRAASLTVYYSGHADERALHLGDTTLPLADVESLVRGSAAQFRLLIVDACRSGALTRVKGGVVGLPVPIAREVPTADGVVFLTASAQNEDAQESDAVRGSFFTHYLVSGLRGGADADGDGEVDVDEAYRFAYEHTLRASSTSALGPQHATYRFEVKGRTGMTLTRTSSAAHALVTFPRGTGWFVFAGDADGAVLAELGPDDARRTLALRPERLFIRGRARDALLETRVAPRAGERVDVGALPMTRSAYARLVRKGGGGAANALELGYRFGSDLVDVSHGVGVGFVHERETVTLSLRAGVDFGEHARTTTLESTAGELAGWTLVTRTRVVDLGVALHKAFDLGSFSLEVGAGVALAWLHQDFDYVGDAPPRDSLAGRFDAVLGVVVDLSERLYLRAEAIAQLWLFNREHDDGAALAPVFGPRLALGLGWRF